MSQETKKNRKQDILQAALRCFVEDGYESTTIADIQRESGASVGSIYHFFGNKQGIALALYQGGLADYREVLLQRLEECEDARSFVRTLVKYHLSWAHEHPNWAKYLHYMRRLEPIVTHKDEIKASTKAFSKHILSMVKPSIEAGEVKPMPIEFYVIIILGPAHEAVRRWLAGGLRTDIREAQDILADAAWAALRPEE